MEKQVSINDNIRMLDRLGDHNRFIGIKGFVNIFLNDKLVEVKKSNLVVCMGRQYILQRIFNTDNGLDSGYDQWPGSTVSYFGIGYGGTDWTGTTEPTGGFSFLGPNSDDKGFGTNTGYNPKFYIFADAPSTNYIKLPSDSGYTDDKGVLKSITYDANNDTTDTSRIQFKSASCAGYSNEIILTCKVELGEPVQYYDPDTSMVIDIGLAEDIKIDEACLYFTQSTAAYGIFAHVCFSPKFKNIGNDVLVIEWHVLA